MTIPDTSAEFKLLATAASYLRQNFEEEYMAWVDSPFEWILHLPAGSKGKLGKHLVYQWCALKGLAVDRCSDSEADMLVNGHRVEVKFSTLWKAGIYKFQQIRDQNYEYSVCLGISPFDAHCWVVSKVILKKYVIGQMGQHTGSGSLETAWISVIPQNPPEWLAPYGGTLEKAFSVLKTLSTRKK
jgi:hypothetical protein